LGRTPFGPLGPTSYRLTKPQNAPNSSRILRQIRMKATP
jgi:hypothetical protein